MYGSNSHKMSVYLISLNYILKNDYKVGEGQSYPMLGMLAALLRTQVGFLAPQWTAAHNCL